MNELFLPGMVKFEERRQGEGDRAGCDGGDGGIGAPGRRELASSGGEDRARGRWVGA